jgi:hypothetical protein
MYKFFLVTAPTGTTDSLLSGALGIDQRSEPLLVSTPLGHADKEKNEVAERANTAAEI